MSISLLGRTCEYPHIYDDAVSIARRRPAIVWPVSINPIRTTDGGTPIALGCDARYYIVQQIHLRVLQVEELFGCLRSPFGHDVLLRICHLLSETHLISKAFQLLQQELSAVVRYDDGTPCIMKTTLTPLHGETFRCHTRQLFTSIHRE